MKQMIIFFHSENKNKGPNICNNILSFWLLIELTILYKKTIGRFSSLYAGCSGSIPRVCVEKQPENVYDVYLVGARVPASALKQTSGHHLLLYSPIIVGYTAVVAPACVACYCATAAVKAWYTTGKKQYQYQYQVWYYRLC